MSLALFSSKSNRNSQMLRMGFAILTVFTMCGVCFGEVIDTFETAQSTPFGGLRNAVSGPGILGNERDVILDDQQGNLVAGNGFATYRSLDGGGITFEWDGVQGGDGAPDRARELPLTDFTRGGQVDRFVVDIATMTGTWSVTITSTSGPTTFTSRLLLNINTPGELEVFFDDFAAPSYLTESNGLSLRLNPQTAGQSITIGAFRTVPEPSSWILLASSCLALVGMRTAKRRLRRQ